MMPDLFVLASEGLADPVVPSSAAAPGAAGGGLAKTGSVAAAAAGFMRMASMKIGSGGIGGMSGGGNSTSLAMARCGIQV